MRDGYGVGVWKAIGNGGSPLYGFVLRIVLLLVVAWMTLLIFNSALIVVPISLGRALFNGIPLLPITHGIKCNDLYSFIIGSYVIWTALAGVRYSIEHIKTRRAVVLLSQMWKWCVIVIKSSVLLSIWIFVIPVLIGLLFELLVIVPMRVPVDESPVFLLYQDWALDSSFLRSGLDCLIILASSTWLLGVGLGKYYFYPLEVGNKILLMGDEKLCWNALKMNSCVVNQGMFESKGQKVEALKRIFHAILGPLGAKGDCVPNHNEAADSPVCSLRFSQRVFPVLGYPLVVNSAVYRFAWLGCLCFSLLCFCAKRFHVWFTNLHNSIRDDRYLIGRRLHNYGEDTEGKQNEVEDIPSETQSANLHGTALIRHDREADIGMRLRRANRHDA
ncbi:putative E3 ubiquitin ligase SUD1 [Vitis vinifera]|uniref:RING-type E3 ubiquitin transferase n=1 Tax=Vitis vinifera TaxID=29760 RepID=A0A438EPZ3_VITVI|nr:putative E3 ubiquitin ligase SUD1 [Vitis vinifera]